MNLRALAKDQPCLVRLPVCNGNPQTVVLAHYRSVSLGAGVSIKPNDLLGAYACSACHDAIDGRVHVKGYNKDQTRLAHAEGCLRTIAELVRLGKVRA